MENYLPNALYAVGLGSSGQLGVSLGQDVQELCEIQSVARKDFQNKKLKDVSAGWYHSLVLSDDGQLYSCGAGYAHQNGHLGTSNVKRFSKIEAIDENIQQICAGGHHSLVLTTTGKVYAFGESRDGQLGTTISKDHHFLPQRMLEFESNTAAAASTSTSSIPKPRIVSLHREYSSPPVQVVLENDTNLKFAYVCAGGYHSILIDIYGRVFTFGKNTYGQCGLGNIQHAEIVEEVSSSSGQQRPRSTDNHQILNPTLVSKFKRQYHTLEHNQLQFVQASAGAWHSLFLTKEGQVFGSGDTQYGQLGLGAGASGEEFVQYFTPQHIQHLSQYHIRQVQCGYFHSLYLTSTGLVLSSGWSAYGQTGVGSLSSQRVPVLIKMDSPVHQVACGWNHVILLTENSEVWGFGEGKHGQLGHSDLQNRLSPIQISSLKNAHIKKVACGRGHSLFLVGRMELKNQIYKFPSQFSDCVFEWE